MRYFTAPDTSTSLEAINDDGHAVGMRTFADGTRHGVFFDGRRLRDIGSQLGATSAILDINNRDQIVGWRSLNPQARLANLFSGTDPATMPRAFFRSGSLLRVLPFPSVATAVNSNGLVVGSFRAPDNTVHAFAWRAALRRGGRSAGVPGAPAGFVDRGRGTGEDVSDPVVARRCVWPLCQGIGPSRPPRRAVAMVEDRGGQATVSISFDGTNFRVIRSVRQGFLRSVSDTGLAGGLFFTPGGDIDPILVNLSNPSPSPLRLAEPGGRTAIVVDIASNGLKLGQLQSPTGLGVGLWGRGNRPIDLNNLFTDTQRAGFTFVLGGGTNTPGHIVGTALSPQGVQVGFLLTPPVFVPRLPFVPQFALNKIDNLAAALRQLSATVFIPGIKKIREAAASGSGPRLCEALHDARRPSSRAEYRFTPRSILLLPTNQHFGPEYAGKIHDTFLEIESEVPCPQLRRGR